MPCRSWFWLAEETDNTMVRSAIGRNLLNMQRKLNSNHYDSVFAYNVTNSRVQRLLNSREAEIQTYLTGNSVFECVVEPTGVESRQAVML